MERINDKITEIESYLSDLSEIIPEAIEEYSSDKNKKWKTIIKTESEPKEYFLRFKEQIIF